MDYNKVKGSITKLKQQFNTLKEQFLADGFIDAQEQKELDELLARIEALEPQVDQKLTGEQGNNGGPQNDTDTSLIDNQPDTSSGIKDDESTTESGNKSNEKTSTKNNDPVRIGDLRNEFIDDYRAWITRMRAASETSKGYITQEGEGGGNMVVGAILSSISSFGPEYAIPVEILKLIVGNLGIDQSSDLTAFHRAWLSTFEAQRNNVEIPWNGFLSFLNQSHGGVDNLTHAEALELSNKYTNDYLFSDQDMQQIYVSGWIRSSQDTSDFDRDAGYIMITAEYVLTTDTRTNSPQIEWRDTKEALYIDDASRPRGTLEAVRGAFGDSTLLSDVTLRLKAKLFIRDWSPLHNFTEFDLVDPNGLAKTDGLLEVERGSNGVWAVYDNQFQPVFESFIRNVMPTYRVSDLRPE